MFYMFLAGSGVCVGDRDECDLLKTWVKGDALHIIGTLNNHAYFEITQQLEDNPNVRLLVLENIPGTINADSTLEIAGYIHKHGLNTHLPADGFIESGGVDLFCGGVERTIVPGGHVGVHSWSYSSGVNGADLSKKHAGHRSQRESFADIGCPPSFYEYTLNAASGSDMYIMSREDLIKEGVVTRFVKAQPD